MDFAPRRSRFVGIGRRWDGSDSDWGSEEDEEMLDLEEEAGEAD